MNALIHERFAFSSLILFSSDETSGGENTTLPGWTAVWEPLSCCPEGAVATEIIDHKTVNSLTFRRVTKSVLYRVKNGKD